MKLKNPTNKEISVQILGREYTVSGGEMINVSDEVGTYWKNRIHNFMEVIEQEETPIDLPKKEIVEEKAEVTEVVEVAKEVKKEKKESIVSKIKKSLKK